MQALKVITELFKAQNYENEYVERAKDWMVHHRQDFLISSLKSSSSLDTPLLYIFALTRVSKFESHRWILTNPNSTNNLSDFSNCVDEYSWRKVQPSLLIYRALYFCKKIRKFAKNVARKIRAPQYTPDHIVIYPHKRFLRLLSLEIFTIGGFARRIIHHR